MQAAIAMSNAVAVSAVLTGKTEKLTRYIQSLQDKPKEEEPLFVDRIKTLEDFEEMEVKEQMDEPGWEPF